MAKSYTILLFVSCIWPGDQLPEAVGLYDKWSHFLAFAFLSFLWLSVTIRIKKAMAFCVFYGLLIEIVQGLLPSNFNRSFELMDFLADTIGVLIGYSFYKASKRMVG